MFSSRSICGRGTIVFLVLVNGRSDAETRLALNTAWDYPECQSPSDRVLIIEGLHCNIHPNVVERLKSFLATKACPALDTIKGFLDEQIRVDHTHVERVLSVSTSPLKRPVEYFWGAHDFVRGLRGALLGHQYLISIGILHRDITESNIMLGVYPWEESGCLVDFDSDMAILQDLEEPTQTSLSQFANQPPQPTEQNTFSPVQTDETKHTKGIQTGAFSYLSPCVLRGNGHTHFDDVESFLYVLLCFFPSYPGPLSRQELLDAHEKGFPSITDPCRPRRAMDWFLSWPYSSAAHEAHMKAQILQPDSPGFIKDVVHFINRDWPDGLQTPIRSLLDDTLNVFKDGMKCGGLRPEVSHTQFIEILDRWLVEHSDLERQYSNCPDFEGLSR